MICIFCRNENNAKSVEHIVPESFGNNFYILPKGVVCDECNKALIVFNASNKNAALKEHGWKVIENPPMCKGLDKHLCPNCAKEQKPLVKIVVEKEKEENIELKVQKGFWMHVL